MSDKLSHKVITLERIRESRDLNRVEQIVIVNSPHDAFWLLKFACIRKAHATI
jgi:hypothetical protein